MGTELCFTDRRKQQNETAEWLVSGNDFHLISANSVRILGQRAHASPRSHDRQDSEEDGSTNQQRFLQRLTQIKRDRGEEDSVRTVFTVRRSQSNNSNSGENRVQGWIRTEEQMAQLQEVQARAATGDAQARADLVDLYIQLGLYSGADQR